MKEKLFLCVLAVAICFASAALAQHPACQYDAAGHRINAEECTKAKIRAAEAIAAEEKASEIANFRGNGITNTKPFATEGPWEIQWYSKSHLSIYIHRISGDGHQDVGNVVSGTGFGSSFFPNAGQFFLTIAGSDSWNVIVNRYKPSEK